jgi:hypothetical protein
VILLNQVWSGAVKETAPFMGIVGTFFTCPQCNHLKLPILLLCDWFGKTRSSEASRLCRILGECTSYAEICVATILYFGCAFFDRVGPCRTGKFIFRLRAWATSCLRLVACPTYMTLPEES